ncbi:potassium-transporting ATPase subunit KdpA [Lysinibacillus sp. MHQ-1]|nr:potassium-transporting ATPase subunit KdpA [Lysinibacillus sp. MHQ-1]
MKLIALCILIHPAIILLFSALAVATPSGIVGITNPGAHGLSQVLYEFASASANNGSGFEGLADNSTFWNVTTGLAMFFGRYLTIIIQLAIASLLANKVRHSDSVGTLKTDTTTFTFFTSCYCFDDWCADLFTSFSTWSNYRAFTTLFLMRRDTYGNSKKKVL